MAEENKEAVEDLMKNGGLPAQETMNAAAAADENDCVDRHNNLHEPIYSPSVVVFDHKVAEDDDDPDTDLVLQPSGLRPTDKGKGLVISASADSECDLFRNSHANVTQGMVIQESVDLRLRLGLGSTPDQAIKETVDLRLQLGWGPAKRTAITELASASSSKNKKKPPPPPPPLPKENPSSVKKLKIEGPSSRRLCSSASASNYERGEASTSTGRRRSGSANNKSEFLREMLASVLVKLLKQMPMVTTDAGIVGGKVTNGFLFDYGKGSPVIIACSCHGQFFGAADFIQHAGGRQVDNPCRVIHVESFPLPK